MGNLVSSRYGSEMESAGGVKRIHIARYQSTDGKENNYKGPHVVEETNPGNAGTVTLGSGEHENQISPGGENALDAHVTNCKKNPGHPEFIPIKSFGLEHLPEGLRDSDFYEFIKAAADLTVRLSVTMTSQHRPEFWPCSKMPYFLYDIRGKRTFRTGSGRVWNVIKYTDKDLLHWLRQCPCKMCKTSDKPSKVWWKIFVCTAAHVVYDEIEAIYTSIRLFYDSEDSELIINKDILGVDVVNVAEDKCVIVCVTCDESLGTKLEKMFQHFESVCKQVKNKYKKIRDSVNLNCIVSHPHGRSKQVSVGHYKVKEHAYDDHDRTLFYTTCTCPGSSGATVLRAGFDPGHWYEDPVHTGSFMAGVNYSSVGNVINLNSLVVTYYEGGGTDTWGIMKTLGL